MRKLDRDIDALRGRNPLMWKAIKTCQVRRGGGRSRSSLAWAGNFPCSGLRPVKHALRGRKASGSDAHALEVAAGSREASVPDAHDPESVEGWSQGIGGPMLELKTSVFEHRSKSAPNVCQKASVSAARSNVHLSALNIRRKAQNAPIPAI